MRRFRAVLLASAASLASLPFARGDEGPPKEVPKETPKETPKEVPESPPRLPAESPGKALPPAPADPLDVPATAEQGTAWTARLKQLASGYRALARVDTLPRFAPTACRLIGTGPRVPVSASEDEATHGRKLYALWSLDATAYLALSGLSTRRLPGRTAPATPETPASPAAPASPSGAEGCSQVMVKEAFEPVEMTSDEGDGSLPDGLRPAVRDGKRWKPGAPKGLFVMFRLDPKTPATDDGWVYGTLDPKGAVTAVGRIASCRGCHVEARHGRLFGIPGSD